MMKKRSLDEIKLADDLGVMSKYKNKTKTLDQRLRINSFLNRNFLATFLYIYVCVCIYTRLYSNT